MIIFGNKCFDLGKKISHYDKPPFTVYAGEDLEKGTVLENKRDLLNHMLEEGKKGIDIQRYKGLGEMNPKQLWDTTMDPSCRRLLQVQLEDAVESDRIFTTLMGDNVASRKEFIQTYAQEVKNLDI